LPSIVRIRASATEPLIVPEAHTTDSSFLVTFHLVKSLKSKDNPNIEIALAMKQMSISRAIKVMEKT
jgi:hypothetical protein